MEGFIHAALELGVGEQVLLDAVRLHRNEHACDLGSQRPTRKVLHEIEDDVAQLLRRVLLLQHG